MMGSATAMFMGVAPAGGAPVAASDTPAPEGAGFMAALTAASPAAPPATDVAAAASPLESGPEQDALVVDAALEAQAAALMASMLPASPPAPAPSGDLPAISATSGDDMDADSVVAAAGDLAASVPAAGTAAALAPALVAPPATGAETDQSIAAGTDASVGEAAFMPAVAAAGGEAASRARDVLRDATGQPGKGAARSTEQVSVAENKAPDAAAAALASATATQAASITDETAQAASSAAPAPLVDATGRQLSRTSVRETSAPAAKAESRPVSAPLRQLLQAMELSRQVESPDSGMDGAAGELQDYSALAVPATSVRVELAAQVASRAQESTTGELRAAAQPDAAVVAGMQSARSTADPQGAGPVQHAVHGAVGTPRWANELGNQLVLMSARGQHEGSLVLTPEHLGPVEVRISVNQNTANVWFGAQNADTRAALTEALPRLRELFGDAGLSLGHAGVSHEAPSQQQGGGESPQFDGARGTEPVAEREAAPAMLRRISSGLLDTYA